MANKYQVNWEMKHLDRDERVYARSLIKTLERIDVLVPLPTGDQLACRNRIEGFVAEIPRADKLIREHGFTTPTPRHLADAIMGIVNEELL